MTTIQADSKLCFGTELGPLEDVVETFFTFIPTPTQLPDDYIEFVGWINIYLPDKIFLEAHYPSRESPVRDMTAHLTLFDGNQESFSIRAMKRVIKRANLVEYANILGLLGITYYPPRFYTLTYVYLSDYRADSGTQRPTSIECQSLEDITEGIFRVGEAVALATLSVFIAYVLDDVVAHISGLF